MITTHTSFASDNYAGIHPQVLASFIEANVEHSGSYGVEDEWTDRARQRFTELFGSDVIT